MKGPAPRLAGRDARTPFGKWQSPDHRKPAASTDKERNPRDGTKPWPFRAQLTAVCTKHDKGNHSG